MKDENKMWDEYNDMVNEVIEEHGILSPQNKINCYVCKCGCVTKTTEVAHGITPSVLKCESCGSLAEDTKYNDVAPDINPTHEWYRPSFEELLNMLNDEEMVQHILLCGLCIRKLN